MKKNTSKGFVLAETIVVGVFIMGLLMVLIVNVLPLVGDYEKMSKYDNLDKVYAANIARKYILLDYDKNVLLYTDSTAGYHVMNVYDFCQDATNTNYCKTLLGDYLNIKKVVLSKYNIKILKSRCSYLVETKQISRGLFDYINYLPTYDDATETAFTKYKTYKRLILEFNDGTYANIEVDDEIDIEDE